MKIYLLQTCDSWRTHSSSRPYWCGTNAAKLYFAIKKGIEDGTFSYSRYVESMFSQHMQAEDFMYDLRFYATNHDERIEMIRNHVDCANLCVLFDNEYC